MYIIEMNKTKQVKKEGTKTVWETIEQKKETISRKEHFNITSDETLKSFRRLGGSETATKSYTPMGYTVTKLISTNPDKTQRVIREFDIRWEDEYNVRTVSEN